MSDEIKNVNVGNDETLTTEDTTAETETTESKNVLAEEQTMADLADIDDDDDDNDEIPSKKRKKKKVKKPLTPEQKKKRTIKALIITGAVVLVLAIFFSSVAIANAVGVKALIKSATSFEKIVYTEHTQLVPEKETDGYWTFTAEDDRDFKVLQFTDVHIGGGSFSQTKDAWAMNAVATMIKGEQPDLVIITGDIAYPVPFQAGTFNNLNATKIFANMMESLGVYWTFAFGNHDTEAYSSYTRADICDYYEGEIKSGNFKYCLFNRGYNAGEGMGYGNNIIKVKNSAGIVTQALVTFDSHSYIDGDYFGIAWKYDNIHQEQVDWYKSEMEKIVAANVKNHGANTPVKNLAFFHIPLVEYREAWGEVIENGATLQPGDVVQNDSNGRKVVFNYGVMGESDKQKNGQRTYGVFCGMHQDNLFEIGAENGLQGTFCGHDHYNNFSVDYTKDGKTIRLTYGMSVDYLAYPGIYKEHSQRGCTVIEVKQDGSFDCAPRNYYTDYNVQHEKG